MALPRWYRDPIEEWKRLYGAPVEPRQPFNPAAKKLGCMRCGRTEGYISRHHIENDFLFARLLPDIYAKRYIEFREKDCARLCKRCHKKVHLYYKPIDNDLWIEYSERILSKEWCEKWRARYREAFERWIATPHKPYKPRPPKTPKPPRYRGRRKPEPKPKPKRRYDPD